MSYRNNAAGTLLAIMRLPRPQHRFLFANSLAVLLLIIVRWAFASQDDPGVASRRAATFHLLSLSQYVDKAIENWLKEHSQNEEDIGARRYYEGDIDGDRTNDLLLVTSLPLATGNYWSQDFILIRAATPTHPIILKYGGVGNRSYENLSMNSTGIHVDALYYGRSDADCCPTIKQKVEIVLRGDTLVELTPK
jgi:hypothetical protein